MRVIYSSKKDPEVGDGVQEVSCFSFVLMDNGEKKLLNVSGEEIELVYDIPYKTAMQIIETAAKTGFADLRKYEPYDFSMGHSAVSTYLDMVDLYDYMYDDDEDEDDEDDNDGGTITFLSIDPSRT